MGADAGIFPRIWIDALEQYQPFVNADYLCFTGYYRWFGLCLGIQKKRQQSAGCGSYTYAGRLDLETGTGRLVEWIWFKGFKIFTKKNGEKNKVGNNKYGAYFG